MNDWEQKFGKKSDDNDTPERGHITQNNDRVPRLEILRRDGSSSTIPYIHIGLVEYNGKDKIIFTVMTLIITITGRNLHHVMRGLRQEKLEILREMATTTVADDAAQISTISVMDIGKKFI